MKRPGTRGWKKAAAALADLFPRRRLHPAATSWADSRPGTERWAVALSGGADSVALLLLLWAHWPLRRKRLAAFHFNHRLRGAASEADARFCRELCRALSVPLVVGRWSAGRRARTEGAARSARFAFIGPQMARRRTRVLWLGHQQDDVAESMMMRLARGSGASGLAAPRPVHSFGRPRADGAAFHVRLLLSLKKAEIYEALGRAGAPWREDASNAEGVHFRNRVRRDVVPAWTKASGRDALAGAALARELLEEDDRALEAWAAAARPFGAGGSLLLGRLKRCPRAVVRRVLHQWLLRQKDGSDLSRQAFETLLHSVEVGRPVRHSLGSHGFAVIRGGKLAFERLRKPRTLH